MRHYPRETYQKLRNLPVGNVSEVNYCRLKYDVQLSVQTKDRPTNLRASGLNNNI